MFCFQCLEPFHFPITAFFGLQDKRCTEMKVYQWRFFTKSKFELGTLTDRIGAINKEGGLVTLDTPISPEGKIPGEVLKTLAQLGKSLQAGR